MKHTRYLTEIAESLTPANQPQGFGDWKRVELSRVGSQAECRRP